MTKQHIKTICLLALFSTSIIGIFTYKEINSKIAVVTKDKSKLKLATGSEVIEVTNNDGEDNSTTNNFKFSNNSLLSFNENFNLNLIDKANPNNIEKINTKISENDLIINFDMPDDKGTNYEYTIINNNNEKKLNFYSKSNIKGYSYVIDNEIETEAPSEINKLNNEPILKQDINWSKDYYIHLRTFDNQGNYSNNKTFKIDLPSNGVTIQYLDQYSNDEIDRKENINGIINQYYDVANLEKNIEGYQLIETDGELQGTLKKEKINVLYKYARNAELNIKYIDITTGLEINKEDFIDGYEGKEINIKAPEVEGYTIENKEYSQKMKAGENTIKIYYNKIPKGIINVKYIDIDTNNEISESTNITDYLGSKYWTETKNIEGYELNELPSNASGTIKEETEEVIYYYRKNHKEKSEFEQEIDNNKKEDKKFKENITENHNNKKIKIKYIDYDTKNIIKIDMIKTNEEKVKYKINNIEGYKIMNKDEFEDKSLIDELIENLNGDENFIRMNEKNERTIIPKKDSKKIISEYEIVLNNDNSDYIIYYKK
ncbi:MAG: MucBP domain-containing protein [Clostridia bacterium]|nr:MucBP domain-containing protein [Clostridia bacterium]